ncbi:MAG: AAA family ATPase [Campylobacterota bacterium]|nr:AAA family ATPase [Campylobacterota bacterium]
MELQLKNIGMIKEANVKLDGLTVIAGENDTGKSTVGKGVYLILSFLSDFEKIQTQRGKEVKNEFKRSSRLPKLIFDNQLSDGAKFSLKIGTQKYEFGIKDNGITNNDFHSIKIEKNDIKFPIFIETPLVWNLNKFFNQMANIQSQAGMYGDELSIDYPFLLKDLHFKLTVGIEKESYSIEEEIKKLIHGEFKRDDMGNFYFEREKQKISLLNTATGIKYFGIFQVLSQNNYLNVNSVLILDEPEVHLHPKWQLKMAEVIVDLVKNGVKVVVNSHSPYMIEALKRYSDREKRQDETNFYLAEDGYIHQIDNSNSQTLVSIYEKLSEPYDVFEEMESDRFQNG